MKVCFPMIQCCQEGLTTECERWLVGWRIIKSKRIARFRVTDGRNLANGEISSRRGSIDAPDILTNDILCDLESQSQFDRCMAIDKLLNNILLYHQIKCFLCQNHPHQIAPQTSSSCCFDESTIHITVVQLNVICKPVHH